MVKAARRFARFGRIALDSSRERQRSRPRVSTGLNDRSNRIHRGARTGKILARKFAASSKKWLAA
jgi:hypothetical protein